VEVTGSIPTHGRNMYIHNMVISKSDGPYKNGSTKNFQGTMINNIKQLLPVECYN